jgi:hypothetical protein
MARLAVLWMRPDETLFTFNTSVIWVSAVATVRLRVCIDGGGGRSDVPCGDGRVVGVKSR